MTEVSAPGAAHVFGRYAREGSVALAYAGVLLVVAAAAPTFYSAANWRDMILSQAPVLVAAIGMTLVILAGHIDISIGSQFALAGVAASWLSKAGVPVWLLVPIIALLGGLMGGINGTLVAGLGMPSIVVTLATMVVLRDGLRWITEGAWVQDLPDSFQWFGLGQAAGQFLIVTLAFALFVGFIWALRNLAAGRAVYATGSDAEAARLSGLQPARVVFGVFLMTGMLTSIAALLNAIRFRDVPSNAGIGLEMKTIAAVVVGGAAVTGGRGTLIGAGLGVLLLGTIGTALTFMGISPFWEKAIQGAIILTAVVADALAGRRRARVEAKRVGR